MPTTLNDGASYSYSSGSYDTFIVENNTTLTLGGADVTGPNAHAYANLPVTSPTDSEGGFAGAIISDSSILAVTGGTLVGGNGCPGTLDRGDGVADLFLPSFGAGSAIFAFGNAPGGAGYGATIDVSGGTLQGGSYVVGDTGSMPAMGAPGIDVTAPASVSLTGGTIKGGDSESTFPGAPGVRLLLVGSTGATLGNSSGGPIVSGGSGSSTGQSAVIINRGTGTVELAGGQWSDGITLQFAAGSVFKVSWGSGGVNTLSPTSVIGNLSDGSAVSIPLTGGSGATVYNSPAQSTLTF